MSRAGVRDTHHEAGPGTPAGVSGPAGSGPSSGPAVERTVLGWSTDRSDAREAEHLLHLTADAGGFPAGTVGATHLVRFADLDPGEAAAAVRPHVALSVDVPGAIDPVVLEALARAAGRPLLRVRLLTGDGVDVSDPGAGAGARLAVTEALTRSGGRAVAFPGSDLLAGRLRVCDVLDRTAVDEVRGLDGLPVDPAAVLETRGFLRPVHRAGRLVLDVAPAVGGVLVGFEDPAPTPCCGPRRLPGPAPASAT